MTRLIIGILDRIQSYLFAKPDEIRLMMSPLLFIEAFHRTDVRRVYFASSLLRLILEVEEMELLSSIMFIKLVVGISATMCHSAEKIPAKEGCQSKRVSKKQQSYPSRGLK